MHTEAAIERSFVQRLERLEVLSLKFSPVGSTGWPDRIVLLPGGRALFIEFKRPGEDLRKLQEHRVYQLQQLGFPVMMFDNAQEAADYVKRCL